MDQGLFTDFAKNETPLLSVFLHRLPAVRDLVAQVASAIDVVALETFTPDQLRGCIDQCRLQPPTLGPLKALPVNEWGGASRKMLDGFSVGTDRYSLYYPIAGDVECLRHWPDGGNGPALRSVHDDLLESIGGRENLQTASAVVMEQYWDLTRMWELRQRPGGGWALFTYFDLIRDQVRDGPPLMDRMADRTAVILPIVDAVREQLQRFFDVDLFDLLSRARDARASELGERDAFLIGLELDPEWAPKPLELEEELTNDSSAGSPATAAPSTADSVAGAATGPSDRFLETEGFVYRLGERSFRDIVRTIRIWADKVEQNQVGFSHLTEDAISDTLCATLHAASANADREVFSGSGHTDIFITAEAISAGTGPAKVFICEAKKTNAKARVREALEDQLFRYATAHMTSAVLLAICPQQRFGQAKERVLSWCESVSGYVSTVHREGDPWAECMYRVDGREFAVIVATVSIREVRTRTGVMK